MQITRRGRWSGVGDTVVRVVASALALVVLAAVPSLAADGLDEIGTTTWDVRPDDGRATASIRLDLRNTTEDTDEGRTYFDGYAIGVPMTPTEVEVSIDGEVVDHELTTLDDGSPGIAWDFPDRLYHDQRQRWRIDLQFDSAPPRSDFADGPRVTEGFVMVPIWAWGADDADLVVLVPVELDARLGRLEADDVVDGRDVFRRRDASTFSEYLVGASDLVDRDSDEFEIGPTTVAIESWPDDQRWANRMATFAGLALPALADWTGADFAEDRLVIRETARPVAEGWGGWNDPDANVVSVGESIDRALWTHELAHNWIDADEFADEWLREGLAETVTAQLAEPLGIRRPPEPAPTDLVLSEWGDVLATADAEAGADPRAWYDATEELYRGAHFVVGSVADEVGPETFRRMVRMTLQEESAWGDLGTAVPARAADWREFLDLAERVGGSTTARGLLVDHVVPTAQPLLARRDRAIAAFDDLATDDWGMPTSIAAAMHVWRFDEAEASIAEARSVRADVDELAERAEEMGHRLPDLREPWVAGDFDALAERIATLDGVLDDLAALEDQAAQAGLPPPPVGVELRDDEPPAAAERITAVRGAIAGIVQAERALDRAEADTVAAVGLAGTDPTDLRRRARRAFAAGDVGEVTAATDELASLVADADGRGRTRLLGAGLAAMAVLALVVALVVRRGRGPTPSDDDDRRADADGPRRVRPLEPRAHVRSGSRTTGSRNPTED